MLRPRKPGMRRAQGFPNILTQAGELRGGRKGDATELWTTSGRALPLPEPQSSHRAERSWDGLLFAFYYLWNFMIYGISSLETG